MKYYSSLTVKTLRLLTSGFLGQDFLGSFLVVFLLSIMPKRRRFAFALRLISINPHFFFSKDKYRGLPSREMVDLMYKTYKQSRKEIFDKLIRSWIKSDMVLLDFGCGLGGIAYEAAKYCKQVIATDVSRGVIACAKVLNFAPNITYRTNKIGGLSLQEDLSLDLIYSIAVFQHLNDTTIKMILKEFYRTLNPGGRVICHVKLTERKLAETSAEYEKPPRFKLIILKQKIGQMLRLSNFMSNRVKLKIYLREADWFREKIKDTGFIDSFLMCVKDECEINDDVGREHVLVFRKPL